MIFAIGGESQGQSLSNVECFMMGYDGWKCSIPRPLPSATSEYCEMAVIPTMKQGRYYPATASDTYTLYVIGKLFVRIGVLHRYGITLLIWIKPDLSFIKCDFKEQFMQMSGRLSVRLSASPYNSS